MVKWPLTALFSILFSLLLSTGVVGQESEDRVVARIGDFTVTQAELERRAAGDLVELQTRRHQVLESQLDQLVSRKVVELEAIARGIEAGELIRIEVDSQLTEATAEEVESFYEKNKQRIPPQVTFEEVEPEIRTVLKRQQRQQRYAAFVGELRGKYGATTSLLPLRFEVEANGHPSWGPAGAPVTIVEFSDFECPYCSQINETIGQVKERYEGRIRVVFRQFPLTSIHRRAMKAAEASLCASESGKFWQLHNSMFADQGALEPDQLRLKAEGVGLDVEAFSACLESGRFAGQINVDLKAGRAVGVTGTPALFINGRPLMGLVTLEQISEVIDDELRGTGTTSKF